MFLKHNTAVHHRYSQSFKKRNQMLLFKKKKRQIHFLKKGNKKQNQSVKVFSCHSDTAPHLFSACYVRKFWETFRFLSDTLNNKLCKHSPIHSVKTNKNKEQCTLIRLMCPSNISHVSVGFYFFFLACQAEGKGEWTLPHALYQWLIFK